MPYKTRRPRRRRARVPGLATKARMVPRGLAVKRRNQVSTKTFYFKQVGTINNAAAGSVIQKAWQVQEDILSNPPGGFVNLRTLYDQYKVLAMCIKIFPANVGIEPTGGIVSQGGAGVTNLPFNRGNTVVWSDQRPSPTQQFPIAIQDIMSDASAKLIGSRRYYTRTIYRSTGNPEWGSTQNLPAEADPWNGSIYLLNNFANTYNPSSIPPGRPQPMWFYTVQYKITFRGRTTP